MTIYLDADALPGDAKRVLFKAAERTGTRLIMVANVPLKAPASIETVVVSGGFNVADDWIAERAQPPHPPLTPRSRARRVGRSAPASFTTWPGACAWFSGRPLDTGPRGLRIKKKCLLREGAILRP